MEYISLQPNLTRKLPPTNYQRSLHTTGQDHYERIKNQLIELGVGVIGRTSLEARYLPKVIHEDEQIEGAVYGRSRAGFVMLVATDRRIIYLDKKPLFVDVEELTYDVVGGVSHSYTGLGSIVSLSTRVRNYKIRTINEHCAEGFVEAIESRCVESMTARGWKL